MSLSCKDVSHLATQALDRKLTLGERLGMWLHLSICAACRRFDRQMSLLRHMMQRLRMQDPEPGTLPDEAKARIRRALDTQPPPEQ
jgi:hypothetical protein